MFTADNLIALIPAEVRGNLVSLHTWRRKTKEKEIIEEVTEEILEGLRVRVDGHCHVAGV